MLSFSPLIVPIVTPHWWPSQKKKPAAPGWGLLRSELMGCPRLDKGSWASRMDGLMASTASRIPCYSNNSTPHSPNQRKQPHSISLFRMLNHQWFLRTFPGTDRSGLTLSNVLWILIGSKHTSQSTCRRGAVRQVLRHSSAHPWKMKQPIRILSAKAIIFVAIARFVYSSVFIGSCIHSAIEKGWLSWGNSFFHL